MKKTRRQELKTNELSVFLKQVYEKAMQYSNYLLAGVLVVVLVLVVGLIYQQNQRNALRTGRKEYEDIRQFDVTVDPGLIDRARVLASDFSEDPNLGPAALELQDTLNYQAAIRADSKQVQVDKIKHLKEAKRLYQQLIDKYGNREELVDRTHMSLASIEESLLLAGESTIEQVRAHYQRLIDNDISPYKPLAENLLNDLEERTSPVRIITTQPATQPITTRPATTQPVTTRPVTTRPVIIRSTTTKPGN